MPTEIRKVIIPSYGDSSVIQAVTSTLASPLPNEVQVKVSYSGFSGADINMRIGTYPFQRSAPLTPGYCLTGRVVVNGNNSTKFAIGDLVACLTIYDAQSTYANLPEKYLVPVPQGVDEEQATALILDWNTAYGLVHRAAHIQKGQRVFIHGMSGAVGHALTMLCLQQGAKVYGTASARNHDALKELDATPFTYTDKTWISSIQSLGGVHAVFDPLGFESWDESYSILCLTERSILVGYGGNLRTLNLPSSPPTTTSTNNPLPPASATQPSSSFWSNTPLFPTLKLLARNSLFWSYKRTIFWWIDRDDKNFAPDLNTLFEMVGQKQIDVRVKRVFELDDVYIAHRDWTRLTGMGSVLVKVD